MPAPRLVMMLKKGPNVASLRESLVRVAPRLKEIFSGATVRLGIPADGFEPRTLEMRSMSVSDGAIEVTWPAGTELRDVNWNVSNLADELSPDIGIQVLAAGYTLRYLDGESDIFLIFTCRRHPKVSAVEMSHWWITQHAPLVLSLSVPPFVSYEQNHMDRALSEQLSAQAGAPYVVADASDTIFLDSLDGWNAYGQNAEAHKVIAADEEATLDHGGGGYALLCQLLRV